MIKDMLDQVKANILGVVINNLKPDKHHAYYYYSSVETPKKKRFPSRGNNKKNSKASEIDEEQSEAL